MDDNNQNNNEKNNNLDEKLDQVDINSEKYNLEVTHEYKLAELKGKQRNEFIKVGTVALVTLAAAIALFFLPVSKDDKSNAKEILFFLLGGAAGYITGNQQINEK